MEPMDLDSDGDSSFSRYRSENISDMEVVSNSPVDEKNAVKPTSSFENLEYAWNSILSFDSSPTVNAAKMNSVSATTGDAGNTVIQDLRITQQFNPVNKNNKKGYGIPEDEDYFSEITTPLENLNENDCLRKRSILTQSTPTKISHKSKDSKDITKSKARSLVLTSSEPCFQKKNENCLKKLFKFVIFFIFILCGGFGIITAYSYFQKQICNTGKHFNKSVLKMDLEANVFGQHIALNIIPIKVDLYLQKFHKQTNEQMECKPLVMSFHGWTGVGKNYVSKIISDTLHHTKGNNFIIPFHFPHEAFQSLYKSQIETWIVNNITDCAINVVVIDEMDKAYPDVVEGIVGAIDALTKPCHLVAPTIFLLLSNSHAVDINRAFLHFMKASPQNTREQFILKDVSSFLEENSASWFSNLSRKKLIDAFIPFLPLEKKHVIQCIKRDLVSKRFSTDSNSIDKILKELSFSVFRELVLSNTGCKRVADKVDLIMLDQVNKSF